MPDRNEQVVKVSADDHILDAALRAGLDLPYSCLQGWCLTCAARLCEGSVNQEDSLRYYSQDREAGFVLTCTGKAKSDLVLETHARDAMRKARSRLGLPFPRGDWGQRK